MIRYKTIEVAEKLAINSKTLAKVAKQLDIPKNEYGHYTYTELDIQNINEYLTSQKAIDSSKSLGTNNVHTIDLAPVQQQMESLNLRLKDAESAIRGKADDVVAYQLLQHRQELEELYGRITNIEDKLMKMEDQFLQYEAVAATISNQFHEKKKKNIFQHIFGF